MTSEPTLEDLYQALDWSGSDESLEAWKKEHPEVEETQESGFARNWRLTLLLYALPKEITGDQAEDKNLLVGLCIMQASGRKCATGSSRTT